MKVGGLQSLNQALLKKERKMNETKLEITQRKIRNGLRKQQEAIWREKMKVWNILKEDISESVKRNSEFRLSTKYSYGLTPLTSNKINLRDITE